MKEYIKVFTVIFVSILMFSSVFFYYAYNEDIVSNKVLESSRDFHNLELQDSIIIGELKGLSADVQFLAELFHDYPMEESLPQIMKSIHSFAMHRGIYEQLRFINAFGMEKIRVNNNDGQPFSTPPSELQDKSERYYFKKTISQERGDIFFSPFDLNVENGVVEQPIKPVLRVATTVYNKAGVKLGIIVLNYMGDRLLGKMKQSHKYGDGQLALLNQDGYWLLGLNEYSNWGFMFPDKQHLTFGQRYPDIWNKISSAESGQFSLPGASFTWLSLSPWHHSLAEHQHDDSSPLQQGFDSKWTILMLRTGAHVNKELVAVKNTYQAIYIFWIIFLIVLSIFVSYLIVKRKAEIANRKLLRDVQSLANKLLKTALANTHSMAQEMENCLADILSEHWLSVMAKGSIFLLDEKTNELVMVAEQGLAKPLLTSCARLPIGKCLCGQAAERKEIIFTSCLNHQHEITFDGITEHGHICVPILKGEELVGVLNLYVEHGHQYNPLYDDMFDLLTNVLVVIIDRQLLDDEVQDVHEEVRDHRDELTYERGIVEDILLRIRSAEAFDADGINYIMSPVENTAGDIILSARRPNGKMNILLGDFTGHGLPSALAGPAVADIFYAMTKKGFSAQEILMETNVKLVEKLPANLYLAACFIEFDPAVNRISLWNAGLPDPVIFRDGVPVERYKSELLALGIVKDFALDEAEKVIDLLPGDHLFIFTDGVVEAYDADGEMFGEQRFENLLSSIITEEKPLSTVIGVLEDYQVGDEQTDDITVLEIHT